MKILHLTQSVNPILGGRSIVVKTLAEFQKRSGHKVIIYTMRMKGFPRMEVIDDLPIVRSPTSTLGNKNILTKAFYNFLHNAITGKDALLLKLMNKVDIVHLHGPIYGFRMIPKLYFSPIIHAWHKLLKRCRVAKLVTLHGTPKKFNWKIYDDEMKLADLVTWVVKKLAERFGGLYIPNGVDTEAFKPVIPIRTDRLIICVPGVITKSKNQLLVLKALRNVPDEVKNNVRVIFIGSRTYEPVYYLKLLSFAKKHGIKAIFIGPVTYNLMPKIYNKANLIALPSMSEGMPLTILEAMACGRPVIAMNVGAIGDIITEEVGFVANTKEEFQTKLAEIALASSYGFLRRMGEKARSRAKLFEWSKIVRKYEKAYNMIIGKQ